jgi:hypothetical protein
VPIWVEFEYRDFYDVPRQILLRHGGRTFLLDCRFDETCDDYSDEYEVFEFPDLPPGVARESKNLRGLVGGLLGHVSVRAVRFDASLRTSIDLSSIPQIAASG